MLRASGSMKTGISWLLIKRKGDAGYILVVCIGRQKRWLATGMRKPRITMANIMKHSVSMKAIRNVEGARQ